MSKTVKITYCGIDGQGRTVTEAKANAARELTALVRELNQTAPTVVEFCGHAKLVYRSAYGWRVGALTSSHALGVLARGAVHGDSYGFPSFDDAIRSAAHHVADLAWSHAVTDDMAFARDALAPYYPARELDCAVRDLAERWAWQRRYTAARDAGHSDNAAMHIAGGLGHLVESGKIA